MTIKGKRSKTNFDGKRKRTDLKDKLKGNNTHRPKEIKILKRKSIRKITTIYLKLNIYILDQLSIFLIVLPVSTTCRTVETFL